LHCPDIEVKGGDMDNADFIGLAASVDIDYILAGSLVLKLDRASHELYDLGLMVITCVGWNNFEANHGVFRATDEINDIIEAPSDYIRDLSLRALAHPGDFIIRLELFGFVGRPGSNEPHYLSVLVLRGEHGTDPFKGEAHINIEVLG
jgi:hypothetical protein